MKNIYRQDFTGFNVFWNSSTEDALFIDDDGDTVATFQIKRTSYGPMYAFLPFSLYEAEDESDFADIGMFLGLDETELDNLMNNVLETRDDFVAFFDLMVDYGYIKTYTLWPSAKEVNYIMTDMLFDGISG